MTKITSEEDIFSEVFFSYANSDKPINFMFYLYKLNEWIAF